jgi:acetyl esterase/lipase
VIEPLVIKRSIADARDLFEGASPTFRCHADAPPFLIIHGAQDSLTSPLDARAFAARLAGVCDNPVFHAELPGAQHAFDLFPSIRTAGVVRGVERFLAGVHAAYLSDRSREEALDEREGEVQSNVPVGA